MTRSERLRFAAREKAKTTIDQVGIPEGWTREKLEEFLTGGFLHGMDRKEWQAWNAERARQNSRNS